MSASNIIMEIENLFNHSTKSSSEKIGSSFLLIYKYLESIIHSNSTDIKERKNITISARERYGINDSLMKTYYAYSHNSEISELLLKATSPLEITSQYFTQDQTKKVAHFKNNNKEYINIYNIKSNKVTNISKKKNSFKQRINKFLDNDIFKNDPYGISSCLVYGRNYSRSRKDVFPYSNSNEFMDQLFVAYIPDNIEEKYIRLLFNMLNTLFSLIDNLTVVKALQFESNLKSKLSLVLPSILSSKYSIAKGIKDITAIISSQLAIYIKDFNLIKEDCDYPYASFITVKYKEGGTEGEYRPTFRSFPETCSIYDEKSPVKKQFVLSQENTPSFAKYFIYLLSKKGQLPALVKEYEEIYQACEDTKTYINSKKNHKIQFIVGSSSEHESSAWHFFDSKSEGKGSTLIFSLRLGSNHIDDSITNSVNSLIVLESMDPYIFRDEIVNSLSNVITLLSSILESLNLGKFTNDYKTLLRKSYFSDVPLKAQLDIIPGYRFYELAFDLMRTNLGELWQNFVLYQEVKYKNNNSSYVNTNRNIWKNLVIDIINEISPSSSNTFPPLDSEVTKKLFLQYEKINKKNDDGANQLIEEHRQIQLSKVRLIKSVLKSDNTIVNIIKIINESDFSEDFIEFMKHCHSCVIWSSWMGAIRLVLMSRFENSDDLNEPKFTLMTTGHSALELLLVAATNSNEILQIIKLGETKKLKKEQDNYNRYVRYRITEAARMPTNGFSFLCDGKGIFEYGCLLSDLVHFNTSNRTSTLQSFCSPQRNDHLAVKQLTPNDCKKTLEWLFTNIRSWKEPSIGFEQAFVKSDILFQYKKPPKGTLPRAQVKNYDLIRHCFRIREFELKSNKALDEISDFYDLYQYRKTESTSTRERFDNAVSTIFNTLGQPKKINKAYLFDVLGVMSNQLDKNSPASFLDTPFYDFAIIHGDMTSQNILLTGNKVDSPPDRTVLIDFEQVKPGFYGADHIHLLISMIVDKNDFDYFHQSHNNKDFLPHALNNSLDAIEFINSELSRVLCGSESINDSANERFHYHDFIREKSSTREEKSNEDIAKMLDCNIKEIKHKRKKSEAVNNLFRKSIIYETLMDEITKIIELKSNKIEEVEPEKELALYNFWIYSFLSCSLVQLVYSLINLVDSIESFSKDIDVVPKLETILEEQNRLLIKRLSDKNDDFQILNISEEPELVSFITALILVINILDVFRKLNDK